MRQHGSRSIVSCTGLLCILCAGLAFGADKKVKVEGLITGRNGDSFTLKSSKAGDVVVTLTDDTKVQTPKGLFRHSEKSVTALIPGLKVEVEGTGSENQIVAKTVEFENDDLVLSETIQAGLTPTQQQQAINKSHIAANKQGVAENKAAIAANQQQGSANAAAIAANQQDIQAKQQEIEAQNKRFDELSEYETKANATVYFASGSSTISDSDKAALTALAQTAIGTKGYLLEVKGYADSSGNAAMNQELSMDRADAVVAFLLQNCCVPLRQIVAPGAMGVADPAAPNETAGGRAANRRVDVKVIVNKEVAGGM
jgi:OOP family OmpA-OmpF porin